MAQAPWIEEQRGPHFRFFVEPDSYAARTIDQTVARAELTYQRGCEWFRCASPPLIHAYLVSALETGAGPGWRPVAAGLVSTDAPTIWLCVSPEQPAVGLEHAVLQVLARAATGSSALQADAPLRALSWLIASQHGIGAKTDEADRLAHERYGVDGAAPQLFSDADDENNPALLRTARSAELSFLSFLDRAYGDAALSRFARALLTESTSSAAQSAYAKSFADLEREWLGALRKHYRGATSWLDLLRRSLPLLRPHWRRVLELVGYMAVNLVFGLAIPLSVKYLLDDVIPSQDFGRLAVWLVAVLAVFAAGSWVTYRRMVVASLVGEMILRDMRRASFEHLQRLSQRFFARSSTGDLMSRLTGDMDAVRGALADTLPVLIIQFLSLTVGSIALLLLNWQLGLLVLLLGAPISAAVYARRSDALREASRQRQDQVGALTSFLQESLSAQSVVKSFSLERRMVAAFAGFLDQLFLGSMSLARLNAGLFGSSFLVFLGIRVTVLTVGAVLIMTDQMTVGALIAFVEMIVQVLSPVSSLSGLYQQLQSATGSFDRIQELMDEVPDVAEDPLAIALPDLDQEIRLDQVSFRYGDGESGLSAVSLVIPAGQRVGVVGPSGAGKSTLIGLLLRFYDPDDGRILFDGRDVREATLSSLRSQQALVPQDPFLFNTTIAENIALGREGAGHDDIVRAAQAAAVHDVIERTEHGYQTPVGERGVRLSGGQRQRLAIARALLRSPRLLLLDEATSALDPATEAAIAETLEEVGRGRTTLMITHRLSSVVDCDRIFVLELGRLVEEGTHQELMDRRGLYCRLFTEQQSGVLEAMTPAVIEPRQLAEVPLFASLTLSELGAIARRMDVEHYPTDAFIVREGETADKLFVLAEGEVEVLVEDHRGRPRQVTVLRNRSYFGEVALLGDYSTRRTASVRAISPTRLYSLHKEDFISLLDGHPAIRETVERLARMRTDQTKDMAAPGEVFDSAEQER